MNAPTFLDLGRVLRIHSNQICLYGGSRGIRDMGLLESAIAMPRASFGGEWLHKDDYEMAAAYAFHISRNHPFVDGNKRTGLACALAFFKLNGLSVSDPEGLLYEAMVKLATGGMDKTEFASLLRSLPRLYS